MTKVFCFFFSKKKSFYPSWAPAALFAALALAAFSIRAWHGIHFWPFGDESEHFVGAKALAAGDILYRGYVDAHGPVIFMLTQAFGAVVGWREPVLARWLCVGMAIIATFAVAASPGGLGSRSRFLQAGLFLGSIAAVWLMQGLYLVSYHPVAGLLWVVALALLFVPAWRGMPPGAWQAGGAGASLGLLVFTAYAFVPSAIVLSAGGILAADRQRPRLALALLGGVACGCAAVLAWMAMFADFRGYIAFHFVANQFFYARYFNFSFTAFLHSLALSAAPVRLVHTLGLISAGTSFAILLVSGWRRPGAGGLALLRHGIAITLGYAATLLLDARGSAIFQDGAMVTASLGTFALVVGPLLAALPPVAGAGAALLCMAAFELTAQQALVTPGGLPRAQMGILPRTSLARSDAPLFRAIRAAVRPNERMLAVPYNPTAYLLADRLPMAGYYEWLPWDADYALAPVLGQTHDLCADLARGLPPVIIFDNWVVWAQYAPSKYMPCVLALLATQYVREPANPTLFVRLDRAPSGPPGLSRP